MPGIRPSREAGTFLTSKVLYRGEIATADDYASVDTWAPPNIRWNDDTLIPMIRPDINSSVYTAGHGRPDGSGGLFEPGIQGWDAYIALYVRLIRGAGVVYNEDITYDSGSMARIQVFAWGGHDSGDGVMPQNVTDHEWCLHSTHVIPCNRQINIDTIPAVPYIVLVENMPDDSGLFISEQHTE